MHFPKHHHLIGIITNLPILLLLATTTIVLHTTSTTSTIFLHAEALTIPGAGAWGYSTYTCTYADDCSTSSSGTYHIIDFSQMYTTAGSNPATPAVLYIEGLQIHVPVRIALTGNEPSVVATFVKPYGDVSNKAAFWILGVFGVGTVITVDGGIFTMISGIATQYFYVNGALTLLGSKIIVKNVVSYNSAGILGFNAINIQFGGSVEMYNNTMYITTESTVSPSFRSVFSSSGLTVSDSSKVIVEGNTISYSTVSPKTAKLAVMMLTGPASMSTSSQLKATSNYFYMNQITDSTAVQLFGAAFEAGLTMSNSSVDIQSNWMKMAETQLSSFQFTYLLMLTTTTLLDQASINVYNNSVDAVITLLSNTGTSKTQLAVFTDNVSMAGSCTVSISQNSLVSAFVNGASQGQFMNLLGMATLTLNTSRFHLHNNSVNTSVPFATNYCKIFVAQVSGLHADTTLRSSFEVTSNRLNANIHPTVLTGDAAIVYIGDELNTLSKNTVLVAQNSYAISPESYNTNALVLLLSSAAPGSIMTMCANIIGSNIYSKTKKTETFGEPVTLLCNPTMTPVYRTPTPFLAATLTVPYTTSTRTPTLPPPPPPTSATSPTSPSSPLPCPATINVTMLKDVSVGRNGSVLTPLAVVEDTHVRMGTLVIRIDSPMPFTTPSGFTFTVSALGIQDPRSFPAVVNTAGIRCAFVNSSTFLNQTVECRFPVSPDYTLRAAETLVISADPSTVGDSGCIAPSSSSKWTIGSITINKATTNIALVAFNALSAVVASVGTAAVVIVGDGVPIEAQVLVLILDSACSSNTDKEATQILHYFVSPFWDMGWGWTMGGNVLVAAGFLAIHAGVLGLVFAVQRRRGLEPQFHLLSSALMFPGLSLLVAQLLFTGVAFGAFNVIREGGSMAAVSVVGLLYICIVPTALVYIVGWVASLVFESYHDDQAGGVEGEEGGESPTSAPTTTTRRCLPLRWLYPIGTWLPSLDARRYFGVVGTYKKGYRLGIVSPMVLGLIVTLLLGAVPLQVKCEFAFAIAAVATTLLGGALLVTRPMRSLALSLTSAVATLLVGCLAVLQIVAMSDNSDGVEMGKTAVSYCVIGMILVRSALSVWMAHLEGPCGKLRERLEQKSDLKVDDSGPVFSGSKYSIKIPHRGGEGDGGIGSDGEMTTTTPMNTTTGDPSTAPPNNHLNNLSFASTSSASSVRTKSSMSASSRLRPCDVPVSGLYSSSILLSVSGVVSVHDDGLALSAADHPVLQPLVFGNPDVLSADSTPNQSQSGQRTPLVFSLSGLDSLQRTPYNLDQGGSYIASRRRLSATSFGSSSGAHIRVVSSPTSPPNEPSVPMRLLDNPSGQYGD